MTMDLSKLPSLIREVVMDYPIENIVYKPSHQQLLKDSGIETVDHLHNWLTSDNRIDITGLKEKSIEDIEIRLDRFLRNIQSEIPDNANSKIFVAVVSALAVVLAVLIGNIPLSKPRLEIPKGYQLKSGDTVGVFIESVVGESDTAPPVNLGNPELGIFPSTGYPVVIDENGSLFLPLLDKPVVASGKTIEELREAIQVAYKGDAFSEQFPKEIKPAEPSSTNTGSNEDTNLPPGLLAPPRWRSRIDADAILTPRARIIVSLVKIRRVGRSLLFKFVTTLVGFICFCIPVYFFIQERRKSTPVYPITYTMIFMFLVVATAILVAVWLPEIAY